MNKKIFALTCDQFNLGIHFLTWSIHYCSNEKNFFNVRDDSFVTIPENPFEGVTAHKMPANTTTSPVKDLRVIMDRSEEKLNHIREFPDASYLETGIPSNKTFLATMKANGIKSVNLTCSGPQFIIGFLRWHDAKPNWQHNFDAVKKHCKHYWPKFFDDAHIYENGLTTWHDIREGIAFNVRPYEFPAMGNNDKNTYDCQLEDLLTNGKKEILAILDFLNIKVYEQNLDHWCAMQNIWKDHVYHYINFCNDIEMIIECILNHRSMSLEHYRMDVLKEGVLLHLLMFKHDLNLARSVEKLPRDTKIIYDLLGKNNRTGHDKLY